MGHDLCIPSVPAHVSLFLSFFTQFSRAMRPDRLFLEARNSTIIVHRSDELWHYSKRIQSFTYRLHEFRERKVLPRCIHHSPFII